jgi:hypothetical protein
MWDKAMSGANYFRFNICSFNEAICRFCTGKLETTEHKITECVEEQCVELRDAAFKEFDDKMLQLSRTQHHRVVTALRWYITILKEVNSGLAWLGMWFGDQASRIGEAIDNASLTTKQYRILRNVVKKLSATAIQIVRKHDEAVVYRDILDEQTPGLDPVILQTRIEAALSRGELTRRFNMKALVKKRKNYDKFEELGGASKLTKTVRDVDVEEDPQRDNNSHFMDLLMMEPFEDDHGDASGLKLKGRVGERPADWENWKKKKKKG